MKLLLKILLQDKNQLHATWETCWYESSQNTRTELTLLHTEVQTTHKDEAVPPVLGAPCSGQHPTAARARTAARTALLSIILPP